ncbi:MAG: hypothetical protein AAGB15_05580 [Pseudomonadota bacterium]
MASGLSVAPLLRIVIHHGYFGMEQPGFVLRPSNPTTKTLLRAGYRIRPRQNGIELYASAPLGKVPGADPEVAPTASFWLDPTSDLLETVTAADWNGEARGACLFYSERHAKDFNILSSEAEVLPIHKSNFHDRYDHPLTGKTLALVAWRGGAPVWTGPLRMPGATSLDLPFAGVSEGRYHLMLDGKLLRDFVLTDRSPTNFRGLVDLDLSTAQTVGKNADPTAYHLIFAARETRWRYVLRSFAQTADLSGARVLTQPEGVSFAAPVLKTVAGSQAWVSESRDRIPLYSDPRDHHRFVLQLPKEHGLAPPAIALPYASPELTLPEREGQTTELWSSIYVGL